MKLARPLLALAFTLTVGTALLLVGTASAQYPQITGSVTASVSDSTPVTNSQTIVSVLVLNTSGAPAPGAEVTFDILSGPPDVVLGSRSVTKTTDARGIATAPLSVGSTPGVIVIGVTSGGYGAQVIVNVQKPAPLPPAAPVVSPPNTGDGGLVPGDARGNPIVIIAMLIALSTLVSAGLLRKGFGPS